MNAWNYILECERMKKKYNEAYAYNTYTPLFWLF